MIMLITGSLRAPECAAAVERKTHQSVVVASSLEGAMECLQQQEAEALVIDESFQQVKTGVDSLITSQAATAMPIYVNLSLHGAERVALEVSCGLQRLGRERLLARLGAARELSSELRSEVTAILLNAELALRAGPLPEGAAQKLRAIYEMAEKMRNNLNDVPEAAPVNRAKLRLVEREAPARSNH